MLKTQVTTVRKISPVNCNCAAKCGARLHKLLNIIHKSIMTYQTSLWTRIRADFDVIIKENAEPVQQEEVTTTTTTTWGSRPIQHIAPGDPSHGRTKKWVYIPRTHTNVRYGFRGGPGSRPHPRPLPVRVVTKRYVKPTTYIDGPGGLVRRPTRSNEHLKYQYRNRHIIRVSGNRHGHKYWQYRQIPVRGGQPRFVPEMQMRLIGGRGSLPPRYTTPKITVTKRFIRNPKTITTRIQENGRNYRSPQWRRPTPVPVVRVKHYRRTQPVYFQPKIAYISPAPIRREPVTTVRTITTTEPSCETTCTETQSGCC